MLDGPLSFFLLLFATVFVNLPRDTFLDYDWNKVFLSPSQGGCWPPGSRWWRPWCRRRCCCSPCSVFQVSHLCCLWLMIDFIILDDFFGNACYCKLSLMMLAMLMMINQPDVFRWCEAIQEKRNMVLVAHNGEKVCSWSFVSNVCQRQKEAFADDEFKLNIFSLTTSCCSAWLEGSEFIFRPN